MTKTMTKNPAVRNEVLEVLKTLDTFSALLTDETAALKKADFKAVDGLQAAKKALAKQYHAQVTALAAHKGEIGTLEIALRERLIRTRTAFTIILNDNMRALESVKASTKRLAERILDVARKSVVDERQTNYSRQAQTQACKTSTLSLSVDQNL